MTPILTLLGIACAITGQSTIDTTEIEAQLTPAEHAQVEEFIADGSCLPENLEEVLRTTEQQQKSGQMPGIILVGEPCRTCR